MPEMAGRLSFTMFLLFVAGMIVTSIQGGEGIYALVVGAAICGAGYVLFGGGE